MDQKKLEGLFDELTDKLISRVKSGDATAADLNVARAFLKDNGIDIGNPGALKPLADAVTAVLPFETPEDAPVSKRKSS